MKPLIPCSKCGAPLRAVYLKDGICYGCWHPEYIVVCQPVPEKVRPSKRRISKARMLKALKIVYQHQVLPMDGLDRALFHAVSTYRESGHLQGDLATVRNALLSFGFEPDLETA